MQLKGDRSSWKIRNIKLKGLINMTIDKIVLKTLKKECNACSACVTNLEAENLRHALARLHGISKVKVDEINGKVTIEYDKQKIGLSKITERIEKLGYQVEIVSGGII
jgi:copper chaperone CopZ